jgi:hypothetical protein
MSNDDNKFTISSHLQKHRFILYFIGVVGSYVAFFLDKYIVKLNILTMVDASLIAILFAVLSASYELNTKIMDIQSEIRKPVVEAIFGGDAVNNKLKYIVAEAKTGDEIFVSAERTPSEFVSKERKRISESYDGKQAITETMSESKKDTVESAYYEEIKNKAVKGIIVLKRLVYIAPFGMESEFLFNWDEIPGNDSLRLIDFLKQKFSIDWVKTAKIEKIDNGMTIRLSIEKKNLLLKLNTEKTKLNIEIDNRTDGFIAKRENDKLNIYENDYKTRIDNLKKWTYEENKDIKKHEKFENYIIRYTDQPFMRYIYLKPIEESQNRRYIIMIGMLGESIRGVQSRTLRALYIEGTRKTVEGSFGKQIEDFWCVSQETFEDCLKKQKDIAQQIIDTV